jgi:hypothetical protein
VSALDGKVHLTHPDLPGAEQLSPKDAVALWTSRGWVVSDAIPEHLDPDAPNRGDIAPADVPAVEPAPAEAPAEAPDTTEAAVAEVTTTNERKNRA